MLQQYSICLRIIYDHKMRIIYDGRKYQQSVKSFTMPRLGTPNPEATLCHGHDIPKGVPFLSGHRTHPKWVTELGQFDVHFIPRTTIKSQVLSDFVANWTVPEDGKVGHTNNERSTMAFNGAFSIQGAGVGFILTSLKGDQF